MLDVELPEVDAERARQDAEADRLAQEAAGVFSTGKEKPVVVHSGEPLMSPAQAAQRLGPKVLAVLEEKFNGSLTDIRYPDENDLLF
ncbi:MULTISPECIES: hypothetical protein [unclassified Lentimonas]|uniref:hypothetical protein n=1 Tax=unclassified Lentimonas TaxID=2630993 RepID=UPI001321DDD9|nr:MULTISPECIES: hypothetical protein [unclassified Lentimonas]CAA6679839.1 Unannotated [Lentimonas sp. CC4]CAA6685648.1 Unannotated [Lentimonas sp. CC6]CAA7069200.1 Unannotated [Lentimonas sp. CC11]CAA7168827.1 Unannotated [Lentimonas sp. CC21]CAA6689592.1 Unannotated [Lentimonas sp. CC19]